MNFEPGNMCILCCEKYCEKYWPLVAKIIAKVPGDPHHVKIRWYEAIENVEDNYNAVFVGKCLHSLNDAFITRVG